MAQALREEITELDAPGPNGFVGDADAPFQQQFFNVAAAEREAVVELLQRSQ